MGAVGGILIADYWVLRSRSISVDDLFDLHGRYRYQNGVNPRAMIALVAAVLPVVPGFLRAAVTPGGQVRNPTLFDDLYTHAWFVTFGLSFLIYLVMMSASERADREPQ
jgi:NCS1 family nucleobase:cation symporter-1